MTIDLNRPAADIFAELDARMTAAENAAAPGVAGNAVQMADSIGVGYAAGGYVAFEHMGLGPDVTLSNQSVNARTGRTWFGLMQNGALAGLRVANVNNAVLFALFTNDIGNSGETDQQIYNDTLVPMVALAKTQGYNVAVATVLPRSDGGWDATKEGYRLALNAKIRANAFGADVIQDRAADAVIGDGANSTNSNPPYADELHPSVEGQMRLAPLDAATFRALLRLPARLPQGAGGEDSVDPLVSNTMTYGPGDGHQARATGKAIVPASVQAVNPAKPVTITMRVKPTATALQVAAAQRTGWYIGSASGKVYASSGNGSFETPIAGKININDGAFHTIAMELRSTGSAVYVDGVFEGQNASPSTSANLMEIGDLNGGFAFAGSIQDVRIYEGLLYSGTASLVAHYPLDVDGNGSA